MPYSSGRCLPRSSFSLRPVFLTLWRTTAPRFWLSRLVSTPPSRSQNTTPVSSVASLRSTALILRRRSGFTADLTLSHLLVAWRSSTLVPHRPSPGATCWIECFRSGPHASRFALLDPRLFLTICPSANFDESPPERPFFSKRGAHVSLAVRTCVVSPLGDVACDVCEPRQLYAF